MGLLDFLRRDHTSSITVDFDKKEFYMPVGSAKVKEHRPAGLGVQVIQISSLKLERITPGQTVYEYLKRQGKRPFCDAHVIDELTNLARKEYGTASLEHGLGRHRLILFLGTTFLDVNGNECAPFLNLSSALPAIRYLVGLNKPVDEHAVPCYAALLS